MKNSFYAESSRRLAESGIESVSKVGAQLTEILLSVTKSFISHSCIEKENSKSNQCDNPNVNRDSPPRPTCPLCITGKRHLSFASRQ